MRNDFCSDYLAHSAKGTTWTKKKHKWLKRIWKNGKWVYEYAITGKGYKKDVEKAVYATMKANGKKNKAYFNYVLAKATSEQAKTNADWHYKQGDDASRKAIYYWNEANNIGGTSVKNLQKDLRSMSDKQSKFATKQYEAGNKAYDEYKKSERNAEYQEHMTKTYANQERRNRDRVDEADENYKTKSLAGIAETVIEKGQDLIKKLLRK